MQSRATRRRKAKSRRGRSPDLRRSGASDTFARVVEHQPVQADLLDRPYELLDIHRLADVAVHAQRVAGLDVERLGAGGQNPHRPAAGFFVGAYRLTHPAALATSDARRVGKTWVSTCSSRLSP